MTGALFAAARSPVLLRLVLLGDPVGQGRPRFVRATGRTYTPKGTADAKRGVEDHAHDEWGQRPPLDEPLVLDVVAVGARPRSLIPRDQGGSAPVRNPPGNGRLWRPTKPDGDNVLKLIADGLKAGGVIRDDTRIVDWRIRCVYAALGEGPRVEVELRRVEGGP